MSNSRIRKCLCCGKEYVFCGHCSADADKPRYLFLVDSEPCFVTFYAVTDFLSGEISKEEARKKIEDCGIDRKILTGKTARTVNEIFKTASKNIKKESTDTLDKQDKEIKIVENDG